MPASWEYARAIHLCRREIAFLKAARRRHHQCGTFTVDEDIALRRKIREHRRGLAVFIPAYRLAVALEANFQRKFYPFHLFLVVRCCCI